MAKSPIAAARRKNEFGLVLMAALITAVAYTLASLGKNAQIPARIVPFLIALIGMLLSAHVATRLFAPGADATLLPVAVLLHGLGYVVIARLSDRLAGLQTTWSLIAIGAFAFTLLVVQRPSDLARLKWTFLVIGSGLLVLPLVPGLGVSVGGARIWVALGPINFQPGEFAKIALALFFAGYLAENREAIVATLDQLIDGLSRMRRLVGTGDRAGLTAVLERARHARSNLPARSVKPEELSEVRVPIPDRPGAAAEVFTLAAELGVNIDSFEVVHSLEGTSGVAVLLVDAGRAELFRGGLLARRFKPSIRRLA